MLDPPGESPDPAGVPLREFATLAVRHGLHALLAPMVLPWLDEVGSDDAAAAAAILRDAARRDAARTLALVSALREVDAVLRGAGVRYVVLKGIPLAQALYGAPTARPSIDLDVLVAPADFDAARAALAAVGFASGWGLDPAGERACLRFAADLPLVREAGAILLELHRRIDVNPPTVGARCAELLLEAAEPSEAAGVRVPAVVGVMALPYLAWHGANHGWRRLVWLLDVARITRRAADGELERCWEAAESVAARRPLALAWRLGEAWLGVGVPGVARAEAVSPRTTRLFERLSTASLLAEPRAPVGTAERRLSGLGWSLALAEGFAARAGILARYLVAVQPEDVRALRLPAALAWSYPALRPARLLVRAAGAAIGARAPGARGPRP